MNKNPDKSLEISEKVRNIVYKQQINSYMNKKILIPATAVLVFIFMIASAFFVFWYIIPFLIGMLWNNVLIDAISVLNEISINSARAIMAAFIIAKGVSKSISSIF